MEGLLIFLWAVMGTMPLSPFEGFLTEISGREGALDYVCPRRCSEESVHTRSAEWKSFIQTLESQKAIAASA